MMLSEMNTSRAVCCYTAIHCNYTVTVLFKFTCTGWCKKQGQRPV